MHQCVVKPVKVRGSDLNCTLEVQFLYRDRSREEHVSSLHYICSSISFKISEAEMVLVRMIKVDLAHHPVIRDCTARPAAKLARNNFTLS